VTGGGEGFDAFVNFAREHGFRARWAGRLNTYLELDGWRYWVLPGPGDRTMTIINGERLPGQPLTREEES
jgi:hypothetical protein